MGDEDRGDELPQRVPGAPRFGSATRLGRPGPALGMRAG